MSIYRTSPYPLSYRPTHNADLDQILLLNKYTNEKLSQVWVCLAAAGVCAFASIVMYFAASYSEKSDWVFAIPIPQTLIFVFQAVMKYREWKKQRAKNILIAMEMAG